MTLLVMTAMLTGALLGYRLKVLILFPAIVTGLTATFGIGMARDDNLWSILLATAFVITALQIGYLGGSAIRFMFAEACLGKDSAGIIALLPDRRAELIPNARPASTAQQPA